jgi:hypothetical protein
VVVAAICLSLPLHLWLAVWLAGIVVQRPERVQPAVLVGEAQGVADAPPPGLPDAEPVTSEPVMAVPQASAAPEAAWQSPIVNQGAVVSAAAPAGPDSDAGAQATAAPGAGAIGRGVPGGTGGVGSTTFFGARGSGRRFVFLVDKSASMATDAKMRRATDELMRSLRALPDFTQFRVGLFDTDVRVFPPAGFARARPGDLDRLAAWLATAGPQGGTTPVVAFQRLLADGAPDAIFFLTDGEIAPSDPSAIVMAVTRPTGVVPVHCVAFGDRRAAEQLQSISRDTGGDFRFVPLEGRR